MNARQHLFAPSLLAMVAIFAACGGGDGSPTDTPTAEPTSAPTATPTAAATPTPEATPEGSSTPAPLEAPHAPKITFEAGTRALGEGTSDYMLAAGETLALDARDFSEEIGIAITSCLDTSFYLSWQVSEPVPPTGVDLEFYESLRGARPFITEGASGQFRRGACVAFEIINNGAVDVGFELRYAFAE